jgi:hypothetical protein
VTTHHKLLENALGALGLPEALVACALGRTSPAVFNLEAPARWYVFPPALIPLWSDGSWPTYIGYWKHWFVEREPCFVKMYVGSGLMTVEIARTCEQLMGVLAMMSISLEDGVTPQLERFATTVGLDCLDALDAQSLKTGDDPQGFVNVDLFKTLTPLQSMADGSSAYTGDFPAPANLNRKWWETSCSFEIVDQPLCLPADAELPAWFAADVEKKPLFDDFMAAGRLDYAWLTLNSTGWSIADARQALVALQAQAGDEDFDQVVAYWLSVADLDAGGY